jgi:hypothetical protein
MAVERGGPPPERLAEALNAPLFHYVIERMHAGDRWVVLDLGAARTETIAVLSQFRCRLDIADLADGLEALSAETDPRRLRELVETLLPPKRKEPTDVVFCWDLVNYLTRPALAAVMEGIAARGRPGTLAHCLVVYSAAKMPVRPGIFVPVDEQRLLNVGPAQAERPAPRYSPEDLAQSMPRYTVERGRLLRNGMQEFLFRL